MCGIAGYAGAKNGVEIVYGGLKRLEYRGYDSAGIATLKRGEISVVKKQGKVCALEECIKGMSGSVAIGHTRWATHGKPSDENSHPHTAGRFALAHNGIIENYAELKEKYFPDTPFKSQTDSEVIVRLLDKFYDGNFLYTLKKVADMLRGSFALVVICADFECIAAARRESPVIVGYGTDANFVASDAPALAGLCKKISVLEDGDFALVTENGVEIFDSDLQPVRREKLKNLATAQSVDLNGCPHYMIKEIRENPLSVANTAAVFSGVKQKLKEELAGVRRVIITGCGTAYNSGLLGRRYIEEFARIPAEAETAGEFRYKNPVIEEGTAVIAVSQSGETADTVEAAKLAKRAGAKLIAVTNAPYSALTRIADVCVPVAAGPEICVAATKSYTGQIAALYLTAKLIAGEDGFEDLSALPALLDKTIECTGIETLADMCARSNGVFFLGRDLDFAAALEGSLKLKEITYIQSEGYSSAELKHGTLALIDEDKTAVVIITAKRLAAKSANAVEQVLSRKGKVAVITNIESVASELGQRVPVVKLPACGEYLSPLLSAEALQLLAYRTAVLLGRDPDKPRNLAKSVTVE